MSEKVSSRWLLDLLRLPEECSVGFVTGATMANFTCLAAARNAVLARVGWDVEALGLNGAAFRAAQVNIRMKFALPLLWGGFVMIEGRGAVS